MLTAYLVLKLRNFILVGMLARAVPYFVAVMPFVLIGSTGGMYFTVGPLIFPFHIVPLKHGERLILHSFSSGPLFQISPYEKILKKIEKTVSKRIE